MDLLHTSRRESSQKLLTEVRGNMRVEGKVAAITGAASHGIGRAIATAFAREGANVAVLDIKPAGETLHLIDAEGAGLSG